MEQMVRYGITVAVLVFFSIQDIRSRKIGKYGIYGFLAVAVLGAMAGLSPGWKQSLMGGGLGCLFVLFSIASREKMGLGDSLVLTGIGILCGMERVLALVGISCLLITICAALIWILRRGGKIGSSYPFMPYLLISEICILIGVYGI